MIPFGTATVGAAPVCDLCRNPSPVGFRLIADDFNGRRRGMLCVGCTGTVQRARKLGLARLGAYLGR